MTEAVIRISGKSDRLMLNEAGERFRRAWASGKAQPSVFTFATPAQLFTVLSPRRWDLISRLQGIGPTSTRGLARALERDVKRVHEDVKVLIDWGLIERDTNGRIHVPFKVIHVEFDLKAVA